MVRLTRRRLIDRLEVKAAFVPRDWRVGVYVPRRCIERTWPMDQGLGVGRLVETARREVVLCPLPCVQVRVAVWGAPRPVDRPVDAFPMFIEKSKVCAAVAATVL